MQKINDLLKDYNKITIFRHLEPDGDCVYSTLALYHFIKDNFKDKTVKLCGTSAYLKEKLTAQEVSDDFIIDSLAFILDTPITRMIDDKRFILAQKTVKIDHHPEVEKYAHINIVDDKASSASQVLAEMLVNSKYPLSKKVCKYLYSGMVNDSLNFRRPNTSAKTFKIAAILIEKGNLDPHEIYNHVFCSDIKLYNATTSIRSNLKIDKNFGYIKLDKKKLENLKLNPIEAKMNVDEFEVIDNLNIWAVAVEENGLWTVSIRAKQNYIINNIAEKFGGGGHPCVAAVKNLKKKELKMLFDDLAKISLIH